jgi:hypothetical protein
MPDSTENLLEEILSNKTQTIRNRIKELQKLVEERHQINKKVLTEFGEEIARAKTLAMRGSPIGLEDYITDSKFEREALRIEQVKIIQQVEVWRDTRELRKEILELEEKLNELEKQNEMLK